MEVGDRIPGGYVFVDGSGVGDIGPSVIREREALARDGFVLVHIALDRKTGKQLAQPTIITKGFVFVRDAEDLIAEARIRIEQLISDENSEDLEAKAQKELENYFYSATKRRPMVFVFISEVD
jgi:ribonuclease J